MTREDVIRYLLSKPYAIEDYPFDFVTPVYKVGGKMFALVSGHDKERLNINLKNKPEENEALRAAYETIIPGYHQNKRHWNTLYLDGNLEDEFIKKLIDDSYEIVYQSLTKKVRAALENGA